MSNEKQGQFSIRGRVEEVGPIETVGAKGHQKRIVAVAFNESDKYPSTVVVEFFGEKKVPLLADVNAGDEITVHFNPSGRKSGSRWFSSNSGWKVEVHERGAIPPPDPNGGGWGASPNDDLPFTSADIGHEPTAIAPVLRRTT